MRRMSVPPIVVQRSAVGMERIENAVLRFVPFTHHEQVDLSFRVVEEAMRDPRAGRKSNGIARP